MMGNQVFFVSKGDNVKIVKTVLNVLMLIWIISLAFFGDVYLSWL